MRNTNTNTNKLALGKPEPELKLKTQRNPIWKVRRMYRNSICYKYVPIFSNI